MVRYTCPFNITGHPAVSMASGVKNEGISQSFQMVAGYHEEKLLCTIGKIYEELYLKWD